MSRLRHAPALALLLLLPLAGCEEDSLGPDRGTVSDGQLPKILESIRQRNDVPAVAGALFTSTSLLEMDVAGVRAQGFPEEVTVDDRWHLGSLTKSMTATLAGVLVEEDVIDWQTTILDVFPEFDGVINPDFADIRLEQLLTHTAGLVSDVTLAPSWAGLRDSAQPLPEQRALLARELMQIAPEAPAEQFLYSNASYIVAGAMLERVTGEVWEDLITQKVFQPLGMTDMGFGAPGTAGSRTQPWGHALNGGALTPVEPGPLADNPAALGPAGTVHGTLQDLVLFVQDHLRGARALGGVVGSDTYLTLHTPPATSPSYAFGWGRTTRSWTPGWVYNHHGSNTYWWATIWMAPSSDFGVISIVNAPDDVGFTAADQVASSLISRYINR